MAIIRRQYVPRTAGDIPGQFTDNITVNNDTNPQMRVFNENILAVNATIGTFQFRSLHSNAGNNNFGALQCVMRSNTDGAERGDFRMRASNGGGAQRDLLFATGRFHDGGGAIGMMTKTVAVIAADIPLDMIMCIDDGTDIGLYLNDNNVLKKLQSTGLFT